MEFRFEKEEFNGFWPLWILVCGTTLESDLEKGVFLISRSEIKTSGCLEFESPVAVPKAFSSYSCFIWCYDPRRVLPLKNKKGERGRISIRRYMTEHFHYTAYLKLL